MPAGAITLADITSADWSLELGTIGGVVQGIADVEQCLGIIVTTPRGSDPLRPTFGANIWDRRLPAITGTFHCPHSATRSGPRRTIAFDALSSVR